MYICTHIGHPRQQHPCGPAAGPGARQDAAEGLPHDSRGLAEEGYTSNKNHDDNDNNKHNNNSNDDDHDNT